jgi:hypothetical protein
MPIIKDTPFDVTNWEVKPELDTRDFKFSVLKTTSGQLKTTDNTKKFHTVFKQINGDCTGRSQSNNFMLKTGEVCSGEGSYKNNKKYDTFPDQEGSTILAASKATNKDGVPLMKFYPELGKRVPDWRDYPEFSEECKADMATRKSKGFFQTQNIAEFSDAVAEFGGVNLALYWTSTYEQPELTSGGKAMIPFPEGIVRGGHAVFAHSCFPDMEYRFSNGKLEKGFFSYINSHGLLYGKYGIAYAPLRILEETMKDFPVPFCMDARVNLVESTSDVEVVEIDLAPFIIADRSFLPIRAFAEALGAEVNYNQASRTVDIIKGARKVTMEIGSRKAIVNGTDVMMDVSPFTAPVPGGERTVIPVRYAAEFLGAQVEWEAGRVEAILDGKSTVMFMGEKHLIKKGV